MRIYILPLVFSSRNPQLRPKLEIRQPQTHPEYKTPLLSMHQVQEKLLILIVIRLVLFKELLKMVLRTSLFLLKAVGSSLYQVTIMAYH